MKDNFIKTTFWEFLNKYRIEIPILQRDYAQGRKDDNSSLIRENFLSSIYKCVNDLNSNPLNLDFIYGSIEKITEDNKETKVFLPLDGQQRLTTLFLLHLYAYKKEKIKEKNILTKFSYETRTSAREFCKKIAEEDFEITDDTKISKIIEDSNWFFLSWEDDPTIRAMIVMLDDIHEKFKKIKNLFGILTKKKQITFYQIPLQDFGLSDDLYIKMNSRGEALTPFENFKAKLEQKAKNWENNISQEERFSRKIDIEWTDFIWKKYKTQKNNFYSIDDSFMRFITSIVMSEAALDLNRNEKSEDKEKIRKLNNDFQDKSLINLINEKVFNKIKQVFNLYSADEKYNFKYDYKNLKFWKHSSKNTLTDYIIFDSNKEANHSATYPMQVLFYAQTEYFIRNKDFKKEDFLDWMRVIRNLVLKWEPDLKLTKINRNDVIRFPEVYIGYIQLINELLEISKDKNIHEAIVNFKSDYRTKDIKHEKLKSQIINKFPNYKNLIIRLENIEVLKGDISFALDCAGYKDKIEDINFNLLEKVAKVLEDNFNFEEEDKILTNTLRRALLATGIEENGQKKYCFYNGRTGSCTAFIEKGQPNVKKRWLLNSFNEIEYYLNNNERHAYKYFKALILNLVQNKTLQDVIDELTKKPAEMPKWQYSLIKNPNWLDYVRTKHSNEKQTRHLFFIAFSDDDIETCYLLENFNPWDIGKCELITDD